MTSNSAVERREKPEFGGPPPTLPRRSLMKRFRGIVIALFMIGIWIVAEVLLRQRTVPPLNVTTIDSFLWWRPNTTQFAVLKNDDQHVIAAGGAGGLLASGSSAYVFDRSGKLVDWSADIGDDPMFDQKWKAQTSLRTGTPLSRTKLSGWIDAAR